MKVLIPTTEFPPDSGGVSTLAYEQAVGLALAGSQVKVIAVNSSPRTSPKLVPNLEVEYFNPRARAIWRIVPLFLKLLGCVATLRPRFMHCPTYRGFGLPVFLVSKAFGVPYSIYLHGTELNTEVQSHVRRWLMEVILGQAAFTATNSQNTARLGKSAFPSLAAQFVPVLPGVHMPTDQEDAGQLREKWLQAMRRNGEFDQALLLLAVCRMVYSKGLDTIIDAMAELFERRPDLPLYFVGVGGGEHLEEFRRLVLEKNLQDRILFPGPMPYSQVPTAFASADIYVQPSRPVGPFLESFGISFLEAQAAGLPCIGSRWGGVPEAVEEGETAILIEPGDHKGLSIAIETLYEDTATRRRMASAARRRAQRMSWSRHCSELQKLIYLHSRQAKLQTIR